MTDLPVLSVLVSASCPNCGQALTLAQQFRQDHPDVTVHVINVDHTEHPPTDDWPGFAGTPMFYLDDRIVSYGNPTLQQLHKAVQKKAVQKKGT